MRLGLVGMPNSGKTTLFNALTCAGAPAEPYPFTTIEPNTGMAMVPDEKLPKIAGIAECEKIIPAQIKVVDIAGLVEGASQGAGLGNRFLAHIREMDAILMVLNCYSETPTPVLDLELLEIELALADLETVRKRTEKIEKESKGKKADSRSERETVLLGEVCDKLNSGVGVGRQELAFESLGCLQELFLLTAKPRILVANLSPEDIALRKVPALVELTDFSSRFGEKPFAISALLEEEAAMNEQGADELLQVYGQKEREIGKLITAGFELLGLVTFYTTQGGIAQSWSVPRGMPVREAAGKIHNNLAEGFIKAEVVESDQLISLGSYSEVRNAGGFKIEGEGYRIRGGEVIRIIHN